MLHFDLEKAKDACFNLVAQGWGREFGQKLSNCQATSQSENLEKLSQ